MNYRSLLLIRELSNSNTFLSTSMKEVFNWIIELFNWTTELSISLIHNTQSETSLIQLKDFVIDLKRS